MRRCRRQLVPWAGNRPPLHTLIPVRTRNRPPLHLCSHITIASLQLIFVLRRQNEKVFSLTTPFIKVKGAGRRPSHDQLLKQLLAPVNDVTGQRPPTSDDRVGSIIL